jgi:hypothetical protein
VRADARWCDQKCPDVFVLSFREQIVGTQTLSQYMYEGRIDLDGATLTGTFKHRFFPCVPTPQQQSVARGLA